MPWTKYAGGALWVDDDGSSVVGTRVTAARMNNLEDGIDELHDAIGDTTYDLTPGEGFISGGVVTRTGANTVNITAGVAYIDADNVGGRSGTYRVSWSAVSLNVPSATGANKRRHRIVIPIPTDGLYGTTVPVVVSSADSAGTIEHPEAGVAGSTPALPAGAIQAATVITDSAGINASNASNTGIRDRRPWARGFYGSRRITTDIVLSAGALQKISTGLDIRAELSGVPIVCTLNVPMSILNAHNLDFTIMRMLPPNTGTSAGTAGEGVDYFRGMGDAQADLNEFGSFTFKGIVFGAGSFLITPGVAMPNTGTAGTLAGAGNSSTGITFTVEEITKPSQLNGTS